MAGNITLKISSDVQSAVNGINSVNQKLDQFKQKTESAASKLTQFTVGFNSFADMGSKVVSVIRAIVDVATELINSYSAQEQAEVRLQSTLAATQQACGMTASELLNLADSLQKVTTYSDQEIIAAEQVLVATRKIGREVMPEATKAILDMAAATGEDLTGAAQRLGQALADPAGEIESLKEANIQLTEEQAENIKKVQEQNGLYAAQKLLLQEVKNTYGGIAESLANTDTGKLEKLQDAWQDLKEGLGETLMNSLDGVLDYTLSLVERIEGFVDEHNENTRLENLGQSVISGSSNVDYKQLSDSELQAILDASSYIHWTQEATRQLPDFESNRVNYAYAGIDAGVFSETDMRAALAVLDELERRTAERESASRLVGFQNLWKMQDLARNDLGIAPITVGQPSVSEILSAPFGYSYDNALFSSAEPYAEQQRKQDAFSEYIKSNGSLSTSYQIDQINQRMLSGYDLIKQGGLSEDQVKQIGEINAALYEQKKALEDVSGGEDDLKEKVEEIGPAISDIVSELMTFTSSISDLFSAMADNAEASLSKIEEKWDEYFSELDEKQERQRDSLNALLASGNISYGDYIDSMNAMDEERAEKEAEAAEEEEEARKKADQLNEAAFIANQANAIAGATISGAQAIMNVWADSTTPIWAKGVMTGLVTATTAAEIATIAAQQYTPLAAGGIVQSPTKALIGEGGSPEMVLPLTDSNMERFGVSGKSADSGVINIIINIGNSYSGEQLSEDVFRGIERAQRTGALPSWRYTA